MRTGVSVDMNCTDFVRQSGNVAKQPQEDVWQAGGSCFWMPMGVGRRVH
jgi:hypothetical protein